MNGYLRLFVAALLVSGASCAQCQSITEFTPQYGQAGEWVTIIGSGFSTAPGGITVRFAGTPSPNVFVSNPMSMTATVPSGATNGPISVQNAGGQEVFTAEPFTVIGAGPYVRSFAPGAGNAGTRVYLTGAHLIGVNSVWFNGTNAPSFYVQSDGYMWADAPAGVPSGPITVSGSKGSWTTAQNFYASPLITGFSPVRGRAGTNVVITGKNLLGALGVKFNGVAASIFWPTSNYQLRVLVPAGAMTGVITVDCPADSYVTKSNFTVQPTIFTFSPEAGPAGTAVVLSGSNLAAGTNRVYFNGVASTIVSNASYSHLTAIVPQGTTTGPITVTNNDGSYQSLSLFYLPGKITGFSPTNSPPGSTVRITGENLLGATNVSFGEISTTFNITNNTLITAVVPPGVETAPISIMTPAGKFTSTSPFYAAPGIQGFTPTNGLPGTTVTIMGTNFTGTTSVLFADKKPSSFIVLSNSAVMAIVPENAQTGPITVVAPAGTNNSKEVFTLTYASDLRVSTTDEPDPVFVGSNLVYRLTIQNPGAFAAPNVVLTNILPASVRLLGATATRGTLVTNAALVVALLGNLDASQSASVTVTVAPERAGAITNVASVTSNYPDSGSGESVSVESTTVLPLPLLSIQKIAGDAVRVSWPVQLTNFALQFNTQANTPSWSDVDAPVIVLGDKNTVIQRAPPEESYYRLRN